MDSSIQDYLNREMKNLEINIQGYLPHSEAIQQMSEADLLVLAIGKGKQSKNVISTKIFEYLMVGKPVLAFGHPEGSANKVLKETNAGVMFSYQAYEEVRDYLIEQINNWKNNTPNYNPDEKKIKKYSFENLTQKLSNVLEDCLNN